MLRAGGLEARPIQRARNSRLNSRERTVSKAARAASSTARMARVTRAGTDIAMGIRAQDVAAATSHGTLTLPRSSGSPSVPTLRVAP